MSNQGSTSVPRESSYHLQVLDYEGALNQHERTLSARRGCEVVMATDTKSILKRGAVSMANPENLASFMRLVSLAGGMDKWLVPDGAGRAMKLSETRIPALTKAATNTIMAKMREASTVYVSRDTCRAAWEDARSKGRSMTAPDERNLMFDPGFYVFSEAYVCDPRPDTDMVESRTSIHAALIWRDEVAQVDWRVPSEERWWVIEFMDCDRAMDDGTISQTATSYIRMTMGTPIFPESLGTFVAGQPIDRATYTDDFAAMMAVLDRMAVREQRLSTVSLERRLRKKAKRAGLPQPGDLNVIYLSKETERLIGGSSVSHHKARAHRVRGHWRRQPYGAREANPRPWRWRYIEEHERGEGPLVETRNVWRG